MLAAVALVPLLAAGCSSSPAVTPTTAAATPAPATSSPTPSEPADITLAFAGDVHFEQRTADLLDNPATAFGPVASVLASADFAMVNLETAITTRGTPEPKEFHFRASTTAFDAIKAAGVDLVTNANNHALDYGRVGLADTLAAARQAGVPVVGAGENAAAAWKPYIANVKGTRVAFVAISQIWELADRWIATDSRSGVAIASDVTRSVAAVRAAKKQADVVVVYLHWGHEGDSCPTGEMQAFARKLADAGADIVVGTHAHLLLGDGWLGHTFVAYGLGNFLWWRDDAFSNDTGVLEITLHRGKVARTRLVPAEISRTTGQPIPVSGAEAARITRKYAGLHGCTQLAAASSG